MAKACNIQIKNGKNVVIPDSKFTSFDSFKLAKYHDFTNFLIGQIFKEYSDIIDWTPKELVKKENLDKITKALKLKYENILIENANQLEKSIYLNISDEVFTDINDVINTNFSDFIKDYYNLNPIINIKDYNTDDVLDENEESTNDIDDSSNVSDEEIEDSKGKDYDKDPQGDSSISLITNDVKSLFKFLPKMVWDESKKTGVLYIGEDGLPTIAESDKIFNLLLDKTAGKKDFNDFVKVLDDVNVNRIIPELSSLKELLKINKQNKSLNEVLLLTNFHKVFSRPKVIITSALLQKNRNFLVIEEIKSNLQNIKQSFISNFQTGKMNDKAKSFLQKDDIYGYFLNKDKLFPEPKSFQDKIDFTSMLGINLTGVNHLTDEKQDFLEMFNESVDYLYNSYAQRMNAGQVLKEPAKELRENYKYNNNVIKGEYTAIDNLIEFETKYTTLAPSLSTRNSKGELQYLVSSDNHITIVTNHLNQAKTLKQLQELSSFSNIKYNPLFLESYIIKYLFDSKGNKIVDENGKYRKVSLANLSGFKTQTNNKNTANLQRDLSDRDKIFQDFNMMLLNGKTDILRTETSNTFYTVGLVNEKGKNTLFYQNNSFLKNYKDNIYFKKQIFNYLNGEKNRVLSFNEKKSENPTLTDDYGKFFIFNNILETNSDLKTQILNEKLTTDSPAFNKFMDKIESNFKLESQYFLNKLNDLNIEKENLLSENLKQLNIPFDALVRAFIANTFTQNIEFGILYSGDPLFFQKKGPEYHKRLKGLSSTGELMSVIPALDDYFKGSYETAYNKKYSLSSMLNVEKRDNKKSFNTKTLKEYKQRNDFAYSLSSMVDSIYKSLVKRDGNSGKYSKDFIDKEILKEKNSQKPADGQGYINLDFYREASIRYGFMNDDLQDAFKYESLIYKKNFTDNKLSEEESYEYLKLSEKIFKNPDRYGIPVLKASYFGSVINTTVDGKAYDKFSLAPLLPSNFTSSPKLKKLSDDMIMQQMGYVKYESGTKGFTTSPVDSDNLSSSTPDEYNTELLKLQITPKIKQRTSTSIPTQLLKLPFANLFSNGESTEEVKSLMKKYVSSLNGIQDTQVKSLLKEMGITEDGIDHTKLSEKLVLQAKKQKLSSNIISALEDSKNGEFGSLEKSGFSSKIIDLISGYMDSTLRRFELPGGDFVLTTNANRSKLNFYTFSENGTIGSECRISLTKEHSKLLNKIHPLDGLKISTIERLNKLLLNKEWVKENEKSLTIILDRVPTQGPNSMDFAIVKEFLSPTTGSVVVLPEEIVYKSGTDFDYDKEKVLIPSLTYNGEYISDDNIPILSDKIKKLEEQYGDLLNEAEQEDTDEAVNHVLNAIFNDPFATDTNLAVYEKLEEVEDMIKTYFHLQKSGNLEFAKNSNSLIESYKNTLSLPQMFAELVIPNSTRTLKPLSERNAGLASLQSELPQNEKVFSYLQNLFVKSTYFSSKNMLGPFAVNNTFSQIFQYFGVNINNSYHKYGTKFNKGGYAIPTQKINNLLLTDSELDSIQNNDTLLTSLRDDLNNYIKQHWDSEIINATVDSGKDPWFALLRINKKNVGVVNFMKTLGYPIERILDFINQPILQKYFTLLNTGYSKEKGLIKIATDLGIKEISQSERFVQNDISLKALQDDPNTEVLSVTKLNNGYNVKIKEQIPLNFYALRNSLFELDNENPILKKDPYNIIKLGKDSKYINKLQEGINGKIQLDSFNLQTLAHFLTMSKHASVFDNFRYYFNFDTTKIASPIDIAIKDNMRKLLFSEGMFKPEDLSRVENDSMLSAFMNNDVIKKIYNTTLPLLQSEKIKKVMTLLYTNYKMNNGWDNQKNLRDMPKVLNNDFLTSVMFNYYQEDNKSFIDNNYHLLIKTDGKKTIADRLETFQKMPFYKDLLSKYPILNNFIIEKTTVTSLEDLNNIKPGTVIDNIRFIKDGNETPLQIESNIYQLTNLYSYEIKDKRYSEEDLVSYNKDLKLFVEDLFKVGLLQSGMNKSAIGFSEFIPYSFTKKYYSKAISNYENQPENIKNKFLNNFYVQFMYNNPKYFSKIKMGDDKIINNNNNYSNKFKKYDAKLDHNFENITDEENLTSDDFKCK